MRIGVIGLGKVGKAVYDVLMKRHDVRGYDKYKPSDPFSEILDCEVVFITVPTLEGEAGRLDCSIISGVLDELEKCEYKGVVAIKSTVKLDFFKEIETGLRVVYNPEFLHEKNRWEEFENPVFVILAGSSGNISTLKEVYKWIPREKFEVLTLEEAEMVKIVMNSFAATKISFWNEMRFLCEELGVDVCKIRDILRKDTKRWTDEYTDPLKGPYGGSCLPKDVREIVNFSENAILLRAVEKVNDKVKTEWREGRVWC